LCGFRALQAADEAPTLRMRSAACPPPQELRMARALGPGGGDEGDWARGRASPTPKPDLMRLARTSRLSERFSYSGGVGHISLAGVIWSCQPTHGVLFGLG
jgi:hypothetical protein